MENINCKNCNTKLQGRFCHTCGEKASSKNDLSLKSLFFQATNYIFSFDNKFFVTFKLLIFNPGNLSKKYINGQRIGYMKPFQVFVISNLFFFLFLADADIFRNPSKWFFQETQMQEPIQQKLTELNTTVEILTKKYNQVSVNDSKAGIIVLILFIGLIFWLFNLKKGIPFGGHTVFGIHFFSAFLIVIIFISISLSIIPEKSKYFFQIPIILYCFFYLVSAQKNLYHDNVGIGFIKVFFWSFILCCSLIYLQKINKFYFIQLFLG